MMGNDELKGRYAGRADGVSAEPCREKRRH